MMLKQPRYLLRFTPHVLRLLTASGGHDLSRVAGEITTISESNPESPRLKRAISGDRDRVRWSEIVKDVRIESMSKSV